jgi:hypothetical protein
MSFSLGVAMLDKMSLRTVCRADFEALSTVVEMTRTHIVMNGCYEEKWHPMLGHKRGAFFLCNESSEEINTQRMIQDGSR